MKPIKHRQISDKAIPHYKNNKGKFKQMVPNIYFSTAQIVEILFGLKTGYFSVSMILFYDFEIYYYFIFS